MTEVSAVKPKRTTTDTRHLYEYEAVCPFCGHKNRIVISHAAIEGDEVCDDPDVCSHYDAFGMSRQMYFIDGVEQETGFDPQTGQLWTTGRMGCTACIRIWSHEAQGAYIGTAEKDKITKPQALKALSATFSYVNWQIMDDPQDAFAWLIKGQAPACENCGEGYFDGRFGHCPVCGWGADPA